MKLFKIELDNVGYDDYDSCVIVAESRFEIFVYIICRRRIMRM